MIRIIWGSDNITIGTDSPQKATPFVSEYPKDVKKKATLVDPITQIYAVDL